MDGENNGKQLLKWMIWGGRPPLFSETPRSYKQNPNKLITTLSIKHLPMTHGIESFNIKTILRILSR